MARRDLARRLNVSPEVVALEAAGPVSWPDASLGCPKQGFAYAQVITLGYLVRLLYQGKEYRYHSDLLGPPFLCEQASAPLPDASPVATVAPAATVRPAVTASPTATVGPAATAISTVTPAAGATPAPTTTPTPTATPPSPPPPAPAATAPPPPTATPTPTPTPSPTATVAVSQVVIQGVDLGAEVVTIVNQGSASQDMTGWTLISEVGSQVFHFPDGITLAAGATVLITSGAESYSDPPQVLQWLNADGTPRMSNVWNNSGDPATLRDAAGNVVSTYP